MSLAAGGIADNSDFDAIKAASNKKPYVKLIQQAAQSIGSATNTALQFGSGSEDIDTDNYHSEVTNNTRVTPTKPGIYRCTTTVVMSASTTMTQIHALVGKNGTTVDGNNRELRSAANLTGSSQATCSVQINGTGDYVEAYVNQVDSGGAKNTVTATGQRSTFEVAFERDLP